LSDGTAYNSSFSSSIVAFKVLDRGSNILFGVYDDAVLRQINCSYLGD
jgi:hypothetical protein